MAVIDLMNLEDQVDLDFTVARRRARLGRLKTLLLKRTTRSTLLSPEEFRRNVPPSGSMYRGRRTVEVSKIVGSVDRYEAFDRGFMPTKASLAERWKRVDRAFHRGLELPAVRLYKVGNSYFVEDGNHRVSVARYQGVETIEANVIEFFPLYGAH